MRLVFPGGEHASVDLAEGTTRIGSSAECEVVVNQPGVAARHCEITLKAGQAFARPLDASAPTVLNGRQIEGPAEIDAGDLLLFGRVGCAVGAGERRVAAGAAAPARPTPAPAPDDGRTRVRATLPRFMLRGVSGVTFGKTFAVTDNAVLGRQPDCDIAVPAEEVSRHHARLRLTPDGVHVEDLGSANGTFINDRRIQSGLLKPGEELRLDTVRFLLITPGMDARQQSARATGKGTRRVPAWAVAAGVVVLAAAAFAALRAFGLV